MEYRREIDGLRAIAVIPVILFHAGFIGFSGGFVGVDIFFVISGYLITSILIKEMASGQFSIIKFYERRARRILPALFLVMLICIPLAWVYLMPADMQSFSQSLIAVSGYFSNFLFWYQSGYFDTSSDLKPLLHTWSLAVEEQYYLIFPLILLALSRCRQKIKVAVLGIIAIASFTIGQKLSVDDPTSAFYLIHARAWELLAGSLVAFGLSSSNTVNFSRSWSQSLSLLGLLLIFVAIFSFDKSTPFPGIYALLPVIGTALVIVFARADNITGRVLGHRALVGVGLLSYSAYLWHQPLFAFYRHHTNEAQTVTGFAVLIVLVFALAWLTWKFVEAPFRDKRHFSRRAIFIFTFMGSALFIALGSAGHSYKGFEGRFDRVLAGDVTYSEYVANMNVHSVACNAQSSESENGKPRAYGCHQSRPGVPDLIVVGDSHAQHLFVGLRDALPQRNVAYHYAHGMPFLGDHNLSLSFEHIAREPVPQVVMLAMYFKLRLEGQETRLFAEYAAVIEKLQKAGKQVVVLGDVPKFTYDAAQCVYEAVPEGKSATCDLASDLAASRNKVFDDALAKLSQKYGVQHINVRDALCGPEFCRFSKDGVILYRDKHHLNIPGSQWVGAYIASQLQ